jgi:hypothetical protein
MAGGGEEAEEAEEAQTKNAGWEMDRSGQIRPSNLASNGQERLLHLAEG